MKICTKCKILKKACGYYKTKNAKDGLYSWCKQCHIQQTVKVRSRRKSKDHTISDILNTRWHGIRNRKDNCYKGVKVLCTKEQFISEMNNSDLSDLYNKWLASGRKYKLTPSIDRIDSQKHYQIGNMRWLTVSENSKLGRQN